MKKQFLNLGKALNKAEQKLINGGTMLYGDRCDGGGSCPEGMICCGPPGGAQYCQGCPCDQNCG
ncbi:hypothetical protein [Lutibacter sp.]|uniref:hypothetical protein n=1 Tax=Lutibacter sp. TaxID=1925666 RepID=UPI0025C6DDC7|nr:hypothetical protein [Lutibacter sp.]MCF6181074.1 hypothetical protein [Lutibacter sp.]